MTASMMISSQSGDLRNSSGRHSTITPRNQTVGKKMFEQTNLY
jgi:hypothetical protein